MSNPLNPEYNFNFDPPLPLYGHPGTPAGHASSGMVGAHEMERAMHRGCPDANILHIIAYIRQHGATVYAGTGPALLISAMKTCMHVW